MSVQEQNVGCGREEATVTRERTEARQSGLLKLPNETAWLSIVFEPSADFVTSINRFSPGHNNWLNLAE